MRPRRPLAVALVGSALVAGLVLPAGAAAHATLEAATPADGALLRAQPARVTLRFDEPVTARADALRVLDGAGRAVQAGSATHPGGDGARLAVALRRGLAPGTYAATYRVISADGHAVAGGSTFSVGRRGAVAGAAADALAGRTGRSPALGALAAVARAVEFGAIGVGLGLVAFLLLVWRRVADDALVPRGALLLRRGTTLAGIVGAPVAAALIGLEAATPGADLGEVLGSRFGRTWAAALLAWIVVATLARRARPGRAGAAVGASALAVLALAPVLSGHGATQSPVALMLPSTVVHVLAMSVWTGGLVALAVVVPRATRGLDPLPRARLLSAALQRFSPLALGCVALLLTTGIAQGLVVVRSPGHLLDTGGGRAVLVKLVVLSALVALGARHRRHALPGLRASLGLEAAARAAGARATRLVRAEVALVAVALGATGALAGSAPARDRAAAGRPQTPRTTATRVLGDLRVRLAVAPAAPGANAVDVTVLDARTRRPRHADELALQASLPAAGLGPLRTEAERVGPGRWRVPALELPIAGTWTVGLTVRTSAFDEVATQVAVDVG